MRLPNGEQAFVDIRKLVEYSLSPEHERGKHKARVFASALGMTLNDASALREILLNAAVNEDAVESFQDEYGQRYVVDFLLTWQDQQALVRSTWIILTGEDFPD